MRLIRTLLAARWLVLCTPLVAFAPQKAEIDPQLSGPESEVSEAETAAEATVDEPEPEAAPAPRPPDPFELRLEALEEQFEAGTVAWRRGDYAIAEGRWRTLLDELDRRPPPVEGRARIVDRHALLHDLGNAAFRLERPLEAVGWYLAALRHAPRDRETRDNLALARREAGLEPERDPDFLGSLLDSMGLVTPAESRWLALIGLLPVLVGLLGEAVRGGRAWRGLLALGVLAAVAASAPLVRHELFAPEDQVMVVRTTRAPFRAEPLDERPPIGALDPGQIVERIDSLPDWVRIETPDGARGWLPRAAVFPLRR